MASSDPQDVSGHRASDPRSGRESAARRTGGWLLAFGLAILGGIVCGVLAVSLMPVRTEVAALLRVFRTVPTFGDGPVSMQRDLDYDVFRRTQVQLVKSRVVMNAVVRKPKVSKLPIVRAQPDPVVWLLNELLIDYPGDAEIMRIAMKGDNSGNQLVTLVTEVKNAYIEEIVNGEAADRVRSKIKLEESVRKNAVDIEARSKVLADLVNRTGAGEIAALEKKMAMVRLDNLMKRRAALDSDIADVDMRLLLLATRDTSTDKIKVPEAAMAVALRQDPEVAQLVNDLKRLSKEYDAEKRRSISGETRALTEMGKAIEELQGKIEAQKAQIVSELANKQLTSDGKELPSKESLEIQLKALQAEWEQLDKKLHEAVAQVHKVEETTAEIESKKMELKILTEINQKMSRELKLWDINISANERRILSIDETANVQPSNDAIRRIAAAGFAGLAGFAVTFVAVACLQSRRRRGTL